MKIEDGTGKGYRVRVTEENRLEAAAIVEIEKEHATLLGDTYSLNTGVLTLTTANQSSLFYLKTDEENDMIIDEIAIHLGTSTGGSGDWTIEVHRNPTLGTVVSDATDIEMNNNQNFGSNKTLDALVYKGGEGKTLTDGDKFSSAIVPYNINNYEVESKIGQIILPRGTSIGVKVTPPTGNTSVNVEVEMDVYVKNFDI